MITNVVDLIKDHEGYSDTLYRCSMGKLTIGYGYNIQDRGLPKHVSELLLDIAIKEAEDYAKQYQWFWDLGEERQAAIIDMMYNLGPTRFAGFTKMIAALEEGDYERAAKEAMDSAWYRQTGRRGKRIVQILKEGNWCG